MRPSDQPEAEAAAARREQRRRRGLELMMWAVVALVFIALRL